MLQSAFQPQYVASKCAPRFQAQIHAQSLDCKFLPGRCLLHQNLRRLVPAELRFLALAALARASWMHAPCLFPCVWQAGLWSRAPCCLEYCTRGSVNNCVSEVRQTAGNDQRARCQQARRQREGQQPALARYAPLRGSEHLCDFAGHVTRVKSLRARWAFSRMRGRICHPEEDEPTSSRKINRQACQATQGRQQNRCCPHTWR